MPNFNRVFLMGNITRDIELKTIAGGQSVAKIGLAVNRRWKDPNGTDHEEVTFVDCDAWGKTAENIARFFSKGRPIFIEGRLKLDQWEKEGQKFSKLKVVVEGFEFVDSKPGGGGGNSEGGGYSRPAPRSAPAASSAPARSSAPAGMDMPESDDIPF